MSSESTDKNRSPACRAGGSRWQAVAGAVRQGLAISLDWLDDRTGVRAAVRRLADRPVTPGIRWESLWPSLIAFTFLMQAITGFFLWLFYSPSAQTAWESVYYLQYEVAGGWLLRGVHHYAAQVLVALAGLYVVYLVVRRLYCAPREGVYWVALLMGMCSLGLCLTGDLLPWDQNSYAATLVRTRFLMILPWIGDELFKLAAGGPAFGHLTLTRFLALHIGVFAPGFLVLLVLHNWLVYRAEQKAGGRRAEAEGTGREAGGGRQEVRASSVHGSVSSLGSLVCDARYWPDRLAWHAVGWLAVLVVVGLLVSQHAFTGAHAGRPRGDYLGARLGAPADPDPANFYAAARPEWSFRGLYQLSNLFPGDAIPLVGVSWKFVPIFVIPGTLVLVVFAFPFIARLRRGHAINVSVLAFLLVAVALLSAASWWHDLASAEHQAALAEGRRQAERVKELARSPEGIPISGALSLLRNDPKTQGPSLYKKQCAVCHNYGAPGDAAIAAEPVAAPDLYGFASRAWVAGLLDPEKIATPQYFGNTKFARGVMARYVEKPFTELAKEDQQAIVAALSAEAELVSQAGLDAEDQALIEKGRKLIASNHCTRCHAFHGQGTRGYAPDLTGYGSQEWIVGIVADPTHDWFYGPRNDRMPVYLEAPEDPAKNRLGAGDVRVVADWLRGEWYEPTVERQESSQSRALAALSSAASTLGSPLFPRRPAASFTIGKWVARRAAPVVVPDSPLAQARALFQQEHCAICHDLTGGPGGDLVAKDPSAPDLGGYASREWLAGLLDPKKIKTRKYFGNSKFRSGAMAGFVQDALADLDEEEKQDLQTLVITLSAEARLPAQAEIDQRDAQRIEQGRGLFSDFGCTDCHRIHGEGMYKGPDLTGYGSPEWLTGFLCDPAKGKAADAKETRYYGDGNYGMPSYRPFRPETIQGESPQAARIRNELADKEKLNLLSAEQVELLVQMLRGELQAPAN